MVFCVHNCDSNSYLMVNSILSYDIFVLFQGENCVWNSRYTWYIYIMYLVLPKTTFTPVIHQEGKKQLHFKGEQI